MFSFYSLLVELGYFNKIEVYFLIVGHTHTHLDQWFGVLSKAFNQYENIFSPLKLQEIVGKAHSDPQQRPKKQTQVHVTHAYTKLFEKFINKKIKFHQIPHCFLFARLAGKAIMQYKMFSSHKIWLPKVRILNMLGVRVFLIQDFGSGL
jgi:hypothetical protein